MKTRFAALATDPIVEEAAQDFLLSGGSAVGAVLCGFFAAAGAYAGVLLSPISVLVAGGGIGARAFDGRLRQPGLGTKRPRGFQPEETIPEAARVAVPTSVAAALVAHAYDGSQKLASIMRPGIARAERSGAEARVALLQRIRAAGAGAMSEPGFVRPLLKVAGPSQGGLLTPGDFAAVPEVDMPASDTTVDGVRVWEPGWARDFATDTPFDELGSGAVVLAVDVRGVFAALTYRRIVDGFLLEDLELESPLVAVPVLRGITRVSPGTFLPAPAPIAVRMNEQGQAVEVVSAPQATRLDAATLQDAPLRIARSMETQTVDTARRA